MKFSIIMTLFLATTSVFAAIPVTIKATADNNFIVMLRNGTSITRAYTSTNVDWTIAQDAVIQVPNDKLSSCSLDFITWNYSEKRAFAASVTGNIGTLHTGNPAIITYSTNQLKESYHASATWPTQAMTDNIYATLAPAYQQVHVSSAIWGPASNRGFDPAVKWITQAPRNYNYFSMHRFPCNKFISGRFTNPGEPFPTPGPVPRPDLPNFPKPVDVKGDHFSCYMIEKAERLKAEQIQITDQFGTAKAVLGMPKMICNPSVKIHRRQTFGIENQKRHLVCYEILEQSPNRDYELEINNQFEKRRIRSTNRELFCVPSLKKHL